METCFNQGETLVFYTEDCDAIAERNGQQVVIVSVIPRSESAMAEGGNTYIARFLSDGYETEVFQEELLRSAPT